MSNKAGVIHNIYDGLFVLPEQQEKIMEDLASVVFFQKSCKTLVLFRSFHYILIFIRRRCL